MLRKPTICKRNARPKDMRILFRSFQINLVYTPFCQLSHTGNMWCDYIRPGVPDVGEVWNNLIPRSNRVQVLLREDGLRGAGGEERQVLHQRS